MALKISVPGFLIFLFHSILAFVVQVENATISTTVDVSEIVTGGWGHLVLGVAFAALYELTRNRTALRAAFYASYFTVLAALIGNQFFYQIFQDSLTVSHLDDFQLGDAGVLAVSVKSEIGSFQVINAILLVIFAASFWQAEKHWRLKTWPVVLGALNRFSLGTVSLFVLALTWSSLQTQNEQVRRATSHIALTFWNGSDAEAEEVIVQEDAISPSELYKLTHGTQMAPHLEADTIQKNLEILQAKKRNVVLVVLESVASKQLFKNGVPRVEVAPFLSAAYNHSIVFDNLTNQFPASTRSHVAINTGGVIPTWASVSSSLVHPYKGQTLVTTFKEGGWSTGLFSAAYLKYENLKSFYDWLGFDIFLTPDNAESNLGQFANSDGWGVDEVPVLDRAMAWAEKSGKPFFLQFLTISTHHPYVVPPSHAAKFVGSENQQKYENTIRFTDILIQEMTDRLVAMGKEDTIIAIVGDHGEAFGDFHAGNYTHKNFLYEENIGNFLMLVDVSKSIRPITSHRRASIADVMPTVIGLQGMEIDKPLPGQNLLSSAYAERSAFFFKSSHPEQWGIRDGEWKFIMDRNGSKEFELYDLEQDPNETTNLAGNHADRVAIYRRQASNWYVMLNNQFIENLEMSSDVTVPKIALADLHKAGITELAVGYGRDPLPFRKLAKVHPEETLTVWSYGTGFNQDTPIDYVFTAPSGHQKRYTFIHKTGWVSVNFNESPATRREEGTWKVGLLQEEKIVLETEFVVSEEAELNWSAIDTRAGVRIARPAVIVGDETQIVEKINPLQSVSLFLELRAFASEKRHTAVVSTPSGEEKIVAFDIERGWERAWIPLPEGTFGIAGKYDVQVFLDGQEVAVTSVLADPNVALLNR